MDPNNPYAAPAVSSYPAMPSGADGVPAKAVHILIATRPWVRFMSVMLWIGVVFIAIAGIFMLVGMGAVASQMPRGSGTPGVRETGFFAGMGIVYLIMAVLYIIPALKLGRYASRITDLQRSGSSRHLCEALDEQRGFWKFVGICMIVVISIYLLLGIFMAVAGAALLKAAP